MIAVNIIPIPLMMIYSAVVIMGAVKVQNLESRGFGIASCIMLLVAPLNLGGLVVVVVVALGFLLRMFLDEPNIYLMVLAVILCLLEVAVGVWGLMVFNNQKVIDGFEYVPE